MPFPPPNSPPSPGGPGDGSSGWDGHYKGSSGYSRILAALACAGIATFAQLYSPQAVLPLLADGLGITAAEAGLSISAATLGLAAAVLPWSFLADRIGRVKAMTFAICAATVFGLLVPLSPDLATLLFLRLLEGVALGGIPALAIVYLNEEVSRGHAAAAAGSYVAGTTVGGLAGRIVAGPVGELWGWRAGSLAVSILAAAAAVAFLMLIPRARGFIRTPPSGIRSAFGLLGKQLHNPRLVAIYLQAFLLMGGFVAVYNYLGFRLAAAPYNLPATIVSLIFLAYLSGTITSRWAGAIAARFGRRTVLLWGTGLMMAGLALTVLPPLPLILTGLVVFTAGFFAAHSIASGWTGAIATTGRAQAASLYNLSYYVGSSVVGWAGGLLFQSLGWAALVWTVMALTACSAVISAVVHPARPASI